MKTKNQQKSEKITEKTIDDFALLLKNDLNDKLKTERHLKSSEFSEILKDILKHPYKKESDIFILNFYLKSLKNFMNIIQSENTHYDIDNLLEKISSNLQPLQVEQNTMLMRIGDPGDFFYIILSGSVAVLVTKIISIYMSPEQYIHHLKILYNNEPYLFEGTIKLHTKTSYFINLDEIKKKDDNFILSGNKKPKTLDEYISWMNGENIVDKSSIYYKEVKIMGYFKVTDLIQGNSFGEIALIDQKHKRTASIYVTNNSFFGILSSNAYKKSMRRIQEKIKRENIEFVFSSQLFNQLSLKFFSQSYWNYFINRKISKGDYLFKEGHERDEIYFIHEGEIRIKSILNSEKIEKIFKSLIPKYKNKKKIYKDEIGKNSDITISYGKKGNILGLGDLLYEGKYFCDAICDSNNCSFFAINLQIFYSIAKIYENVLETFKELEDDKKKIMVNRLNTIRFAYKNTLLGDHQFEDGIITKSGKEIKFQDWFDYDKNFILKNTNCKRKNVFVNIEKLKQKNFIPINQNNLSPINHNNLTSRNERKKFFPRLIPSSSNLTKTNYKIIKVQSFDFDNNNEITNNNINNDSNNNNNNSDSNKKVRALLISMNQGKSLNPSLIQFFANRPLSKNEKSNNNNFFNNEKENDLKLKKEKSLKLNNKKRINNSERNNVNRHFSDGFIEQIANADEQFISKILKNNKFKNRREIVPFNYTYYNFKPLSKRAQSGLPFNNKRKKIKKVFHNRIFSNEKRFYNNY